MYTFMFNELRKKQHKKLIVVPHISLYFFDGFLTNCCEIRLFISRIIFETILNVSVRNIEKEGENAINNLQ